MQRYKNNIKNRIILALLAVMLITVSFVLLAACGNTTQFTIKYLASEGGRITGFNLQRQYEGYETSPVTAEPSTGYRFTQWSDGLTEATRTDIADSDKTFMAFFERISFSVVFSVEGNGIIQGITEQSVFYGERISTVTAIPKEGYVFVKWSDTQSANPTRSDVVTEDICAVAYFEEIVNVYTYQYNGATSTNNETEVEISFNNFNSTVLLIPQRTNHVFLGWFFDENFNEQVTDEQGNFVIDKEEFFANTSRTLFAKWVNVVFDYNYNYATGNNNVPSVRFDYYNVQAHQLVVPERDIFEFEGWYADAEYTIRVSDINGYVVIGRELLELDTRTLYAKWTPNEVHDFKILLVYVTKIDATFTTYQGETVEINYTMSEQNLKLCKLITQQFRKYINSMLDGFVNFIVDEYYTTQWIDISCFRISGSSTPEKISYYIDAENIPEVQPLLVEYGTVITTVDLDDRLYGASGYGNAKSACVYFPKEDGVLMISDLFAMKEYAWNKVMAVYIHEFVHTVEWQFYHEKGKYDFNFHLVLHENLKADTYPEYCKQELELCKLFLLNQATYNGKRCGIPYELWRGDIITIYYTTDMEGESPYTQSFNIIKGGSCTVTAYVKMGYEFIGWSDGVTDLTRTDVNIQSSFTVTALTRKITFKLKIEAQEGGTVNDYGLSDDYYNDVVINRFNLLEAIPDEGYEFVGWSDGETEARRYFGLTSNNIDLFSAPDYTYTLVAYFRKIT